MNKPGRPRKPPEPDETFTKLEVAVVTRLTKVWTDYGLDVDEIGAALEWPVSTWYHKARCRAHWTVSDVDRVVDALKKLAPTWRPPIGFPWVDPGVEEQLRKMDEDYRAFEAFMRRTRR